MSSLKLGKAESHPQHEGLTPAYPNFTDQVPGKQNSAASGHFRYLFPYTAPHVPLRPSEPPGLHDVLLPGRKYARHQVCVQGVITMYRGRPEMVLHGPEALQTK